MLPLHRWGTVKQVHAGVKPAPITGRRVEVAWPYSHFPKTALRIEPMLQGKSASAPLPLADCGGAVA